jgi:hypothetical protein
MKFVPNAIARKVARQSLIAQQHSPTLLFGAGVVGMIGSTVLACRATLQLEEVLEKTARDLDTAKTLDHPDYSEHDRKQDTVLIYTRAVGGIAKLYAPSLLLGAASIGCLTKSHSILQERNLALTAAYAAVDEAFKTYRSRVVDRYGVETDRELRYATEEVDIIDDETGEVTTTTRVAPGEQSGYARWFDEENVNWNREPEYNLLFLRNQQNWWNDMLHARGHVFLNEVYGSLGLSHTPKGALVGWVRNSEMGDSFIDFGCWNAEEGALDFFNGREDSILLDFNVDGVIWDKIDPTQRGMKWTR